MQKSAKSIMANSDCFTELTDAEMEATSGGVVYSEQRINIMFNNYQRGRLTTADLQRLANRVQPSEVATQQSVLLRWYSRQSPTRQAAAISLARSFGIPV